MRQAGRVAIFSTGATVLMRYRGNREEYQKSLQEQFGAHFKAVHSQE
jgi:hypothetical protein